MQTKLKDVLAGAMRRFSRHVRLIGLPNTDEPTFRSFVLAEIMRRFPEARCQTEWHRFDLLVQLDSENVLIEFKYCIHRRTSELNGEDGTWKRGPGPGNESEFWTCIQKLRDCDLVQHKFVILAYECDKAWTRTYSYEQSYGRIRPDRNISLKIKIPTSRQSELACVVLRVR